MDIQNINLIEALDIFYKKTVWVDLEIDPNNQNLLIGGLMCVMDERYYAVTFKQQDLKLVIQVLANAKWVGGHNILAFDLPWFCNHTDYHLTIEQVIKTKSIDTLLLTNLVYPHQPSHSLLKLYKVKTTENNPIYDCIESYQYYQRICISWRKEVHPQIISWALQKLPFDQILVETETESTFVEYAILVPQGNLRALKEWINSLSPHHINNLGAIVFAHWLLHLDQPSCRRPSWLQDLSAYGESFIQAEKIFWQHKQFESVDFDAESQMLFGYPLREGQRKIIQSLAQGNTVPIGLLPTGGGKSLTFQLPALVLSRYRRELTVIISPLKALMEDQVMGLQDLGRDKNQQWGSRAACLMSGQTAEEQAKILEGVWSGTIDLLYISPERLRTHTMQTLLSRRRPALWVMDEAHTISQWGTDFRPDFLRIGRLIAQCYIGDHHATRPQVLLVTATAAQRVIQEIDQEIVQPLQSLLKAPIETVMLEKKQNVWRENIQTEFIELEKIQRLAEIRKILADIFPERRSDMEVTLEELGEQHPVVLIYVRSRNKTEEFAQELAEQGFLTAAYHAGMSSNDKKAVLDKFKSYQLDVVICTNAFGMGIDRSSIHTVIHYAPPNNLESYLQEIGRAARQSGEQGHAVLFWSKADLESMVRKNIESQIGGHKVLLECWQQVIMKVLKRPSSERWFTAQELQAYLAFDGEELVTQIRVILLALERYNLLIEKEQLPALLSLKLLEAPVMTEGRAAELYRRLAPLIQQQSTQLYLPEISVALGMSVRQLLNDIRQLVKLGCARWSCEVRIRLAKRHVVLERKFKQQQKALAALERCWTMYPPEDVSRVDLRALDQWLVQREERIKAREIFYIFKHFKILKLKENKHSLRIESMDKTLIWQDWLVIAKQRLAELSESFALVLKYVPDSNDQVSHLLKIEELVETEQIEPELFLQHLEYMQSFSWVNVSRLDDETQKIFFIDLPAGQDARPRRLQSKVAYRYLEQHYQDRNRRLHILKHWLGVSLEVKKTIIDDYFNLSIDAVCEKHLPDPELAKQAYLEDFEKKILPVYLSQVQRDIITDDQRRAMLVLAGPGSGKTTIIVHRVAHLVMNCNIPAEKILILAYNHQAVFEIRQRLIKLIGIEHAASVNVYTFHGLARHITNISENHAPPNPDSNQKYTWLLQQAVEDLKESPQSYQYVLVDEFQDIDDIQYEIISHLAGLQMEGDDEEDLSQRGYLVAVGDDDQNLYGFRGANIRHIQNFQKDFKIGTEDIFYLLDNYRSPTDIVALANHYIEKRLSITERLKGPEHTIRAIKKQGRQDQNNIRIGFSQQRYGLDAISWIVQDVKLRHSQQGSDLSNFAILARQWSELLIVQHYLREAGIPFQLLNQQSDIDITESYLVKSLLNELERRPGLDIIEGTVTEFLENWVRQQGLSIQDLSYKLLKRRVSHEEYINLTCQQVLDVLRLVPDQKNKNAVVLTTYHSAKGSEYEHVYIYDQCKANWHEDEQTTIRAMYVALTRAKQSLTVIQPQQSYEQQRYDSFLRQLMTDVEHVTFDYVDAIQCISYVEPLGLADIFLSCSQIVSDAGRRRIEALAKNNKIRVINDLSLRKISRQNQTDIARIEIISQEYGVMGQLSAQCVRRLMRLGFDHLKVECVAIYILNYYQADEQFYKNAGYRGELRSHYVVLPSLRITQPLH